MRIAYICADPGVPVFGRKGCSLHVQELIQALHGLGAQVEVFASRTGGLPPQGLESLPVNELPPLSGSDQAARERAALASNSSLRKGLEEQGPFDLVYQRYSLWSFAAMEYARSNGVPGLLEVNAPLIEEQAKYRGLVNKEEAERIAEQVFGVASVLT